VIPVYSLLLVCVLPIQNAHEAAGATGIRHSPRPRRGGRYINASGASRREGEVVSGSSSLRAQRSNPCFLCGDMDCFAALAMTVSRLSVSWESGVDDKTHPSCPDLIRASIKLRKKVLRRRWITGSSPVMTISMGMTVGSLLHGCPVLARSTLALPHHRRHIRGAAPQ
jgi:hypothetical protein